MHRFKRGDAVWIFFQDRFGCPGLSHRPGIILKKIHPNCFKVAFAANDCRRPVEEWTLDRSAKQRHPSDMLYYSDTNPYEDNRADAEDHLEDLRAEWRKEVDPTILAAWEKAETERKRANEELNRTLRPIMARMFA